jgi:putative FmdB family regulatory protein
MPIYAFQCGTCGHSFDRLQKLSDPDPEKCPDCDAETVKRQITAPSFRLSGSGWYETDFKKDGKKRNLTEGGEGSAKRGGDAESGSSKSAADGNSGESKSGESKSAEAKPAPAPAAKSEAKGDSKPKPAAP